MFHYPDPQCFSDKSLSEINLELSSPLPPSKLDPPSTFLPFFPPAFHDDGFHDFLASHLTLPALDMPPPSPSPAKQLPAAPPPPPPPRRSSGRKRALRKDRHSKIFTAQGARDRRMRLSLEVARKFFDLQDMLGFDKASQTVQWLLTKSNSAIAGLSGASRPRERGFSEAYSSECEDISTVSDYKGTPPSMAVSKLNIRKAKRMIHRVSVKTTPHPAAARESRAKARARARERTREKKRIPCGWVEVNDQPNQAPSTSIPFQTIDDQSLELVAEVEEQCPPSPEQCKNPLYEGVYEFPMRGGVGLDQILEYNHNSISNYDVISLLQEQCEMNLVRSIEERGLADVQFHARPWEVFSINPIL